jgi:hypothetical protein
LTITYGKYRRLSQKVQQVHNCLWTLLRYILVPGVALLFSMILLGILLGNHPSYWVALSVLALVLGIAISLIGALISVTLIIYLNFQRLAMKAFTWQRGILLILLQVFHGILGVAAVGGVIACAKVLIKVVTTH